MDLPFLLGTAFSGDRTRAKAIGYALHFVAGQAFAAMYYGVFVVIGESGWSLGGAFGLIHGLFAGTALVSVLLPVVHPRMGSTQSAANSRPLLEPPGFLMLNYGPRPRSSLITHVPTARSSAASSPCPGEALPQRSARGAYLLRPHGRRIARGERTLAHLIDHGWTFRCGVIEAAVRVCVRVTRSRPLPSS